jgi:hypothetical protein
MKDLYIILSRLGNINKGLGELMRKGDSYLGHYELDVEELKHHCKLLVKEVDVVFGEEDEY